MDHCSPNYSKLNKPLLYHNLANRPRIFAEIPKGYLLETSREIRPQYAVPNMRGYLHIRVKTLLHLQQMRGEIRSSLSMDQ
jgi:hypothetical protein